MRTYPSQLRPFVERVLCRYFEAELAGRGGYSAGVGGKSITAVACERAAQLSVRATTCPECQGTRTQTIQAPRRVIELECLGCCGEGEIRRKAEPEPEGATTACAVCRGSGRYRKRGGFLPGRSGRRWVDNAAYRDGCKGTFDRTGGERRWRPNPGYDPAHELAWCAACQGRGWLPCSAQPVPAPGLRAGYSPHEETASPVVGAALRLMRQRGQTDSCTVLEVAYGEVGRFVSRRLGEPVQLALWPFTRPGRLLIARLRLPTGARPHRALLAAQQSLEPVVASMAAVTQTAAVAVQELALARHFEADSETGSHTLRLSRRLKESA